MKNKNFLTKLNDLKSKVPVPLEIERKLLPRLKFMGYVMFTLCLASFIYAMIAKEITNLSGIQSKLGSDKLNPPEAVSGFEILLDDGELELIPTEVLNFYFVAFIFAAIGTTCFFIASKKKKTLFQEPQQIPKE